MGEVFISHTSDMAEYPRARSFVRAAMDAVARASYVPVDMSLFPAGNAGIIATTFTSAEDLDGKVYYALHSLVSDLSSGPKGSTGDGPRSEGSLPRLLERYRESFVRRYRLLDLEVLTPTDQDEQAPMMLKSVFIPPGVRPDAPPLELSKELWRRLMDDGELERAELPEGFDTDRLARERAFYRERPTRPVLDVLGDPALPRTVVLGDPGADRESRPVHPDPPARAGARGRVAAPSRGVGPRAARG